MVSPLLLFQKEEIWKSTMWTNYIEIDKIGETLEDIYVDFSEIFKNLNNSQA